jgi:outer membrane protein OmpA-like peptidoglycan-associated protein
VTHVRPAVPNPLRLILAVTLAMIGLPILLSAPAGAVTTTAFACPQKFFQVSATSSGAFFEYNAGSNSMSRVGTGAVSGINGVGYNTADDYIYGVASSKLYRIDATGAYSAGTTITGTFNAASGGDFYDGKLVTAPTNSGTWSAIDTDTATSTAITMTTAANGFAAAGAWGAYDLTVQGDMAYGLNNQTLYIVKMDTHQVSTRTLSGPTNGAYGAAYSDSSGNAFFYNNSDNKVFMVSAAQLADATGSATTPTAILVGGAASTPALTAPNDGASCPDAVSPYVPEVDDTVTTASDIGDTTAELSSRATANNTTTSLSFCYGTDPTLAACTSVTATPGTISGATPTGFSAALTELDPETVYYYRAVATNDVGTNTGPIHTFTTTGETAPEPIAQTISTDFSGPAGTNTLYAGQSGTATASATSDLAVSWDNTTPSVCDVDPATGAVTMLTAGDCVISFTQAGDENFAAAPEKTLTITGLAAPQTIAVDAPSTAVVGGHVTVTATSTSGLDVAWDNTTPTVCDVDAATGSVTLLAVGDCVIELTQEGDGAHAAATPVTTTITVGPANRSQTIDFAVRGSAFTDAVLTLTPVASSELPVTVAVVSGDCAVADGQVTATGATDCVLEATQAGDDTWAAADAVRRTVTFADPVDDSYTVDGAASSAHRPLLDVLENDPAGLTLTAVTGAGHGTATVTDGQVSYLPATGYRGADTLTYTVADGSGATATATVHVTVDNTAPVLTGAALRQVAGSTATASVQASDANGDALVLTAETTTPGVTVKVAGTRVQVTAGAQVSGNVNVLLTVTDGAGGTATATLRDVVSPGPVKSATRSLTRTGRTAIRWTRARTAGARYRVLVDGKQVCVSSALSCTVKRVLGPDFAVKVEVLGKDGTTSTRTRAKAVGKREVLIATVYFDSGEDTLTKAQERALKKVIAKIHDRGFHTAHLAGYTDSDGGVAYNMRLSHRRSRNIARYLDAHGHIDSEQTWFGLNDPAAGNDTAKGKARNRRVEILVRF